MSRTYPVDAQPWAPHESPEVATTIGIFTRTGYWLPGVLQFPVDQLMLAETVARVINRAYEAGQRDARNEVRAALGLEVVTDQEVIG